MAKKKEGPNTPVKRVAPRIIKKTASLKAPEEFDPIDTAKAVAFGMDLVAQIKREAAQREAQQEAAEEIDVAGWMAAIGEEEKWGQSSG